jgi:hypothetical protein
VRQEQADIGLLQFRDQVAQAGAIDAMIQDFNAEVFR